MHSGKNKLKIEHFLQSMEDLIKGTDNLTKSLMFDELKTINEELDRLKTRIKMPRPNTFYTQIWEAGQTFTPTIPITSKSIKNNKNTKCVFKVENFDETNNFEIDEDNAKKLLTKKRIKKNFVWIKPFEIVYKSTISSIDASDYSFDLDKNSVECLAKNFSQENLDFLCYQLFEKLSKINIGVHSESIITAIFFNLIPAEGTLFVSYDSKITEKIDNKNNFFKCDIACVIKNSLIVIESKFRQHRNQQSTNALKCISYRAYVPRILNFLAKSKYRSIEIKNVIQLGVGYQNFPLKVSLSSTKGRPSDFKSYLSLYKSKEFVDQMRIRKRGYDYMCDF